MPVRRCSCSSMMACACLLGEFEAGDQAFARLARIGRGADQLDHRVQIVQRLLEAQQQVLALAGFAQFVIGAPAHHVDAVLDEALDAVDQAQLARLAMHDGQHDDAEAGLQLGLLVQIVEHDFGLLAALQFVDDAHAVAVALVANLGNAFELLVVDQGGGGFDQPRLVHLVGNFGDHDLLAVFAHGLDERLGANLEVAAPGGERVVDSLLAEDESAGREIRAGDHLHDLGERRRRIADQRDGGFDDFGQIVRRNVGRHADRDTGRPVDQQVRHARRQDFRLLLAVVVIGPEIDGFLVDILEHRGGDAREPRFGVPHRPRAGRHPPSRSCPARPPADSAG